MSHHPVSVRQIVLQFFVLTLLLSSCGRADLPPLPEGEQTVSGILRPAELSAVRRGSHLIEQEGVQVYYAESSQVNLRQFQDMSVTMLGTFEHNTDPSDLPVLVVKSVSDVEDTVTEHTLDTLRIRLKAPVHWQLSKEDDEYVFHLSDADDGDPVLVIWEEEGTELPEHGVPVVVDATRAERLIDELTGAQLISVKRESTILHFRFSPGERITAERLREDFVELLASVDLQPSSNKSSSSAPATGTGSLGAPCGGTAGILCPAGSYCDIHDFTENIGRCRKL